MVLPEITPAPDDSERKAIVAALAEDDAEQLAPSAWNAALLPARTADTEP